MDRALNASSAEVMTSIAAPVVSVVVPTYNRADIVTKAVDSIFAQTYKDFEVIVVDDGSTDETRESLGRYGDKIRYIHQQNSGVSAARNTGILAARGKWIAFLDSDDTWMPDKLQRQMDVVTQYPEIVASATNALVVLEKGDIDLCSLRGFSVDPQTPFIMQRPLRALYEYQPLTTPSLMIRRDILLKAGLFDSSMSLYEDIDLYARVSLHGAWAVIGEPLVKVHRLGDRSISLSLQHVRNPLLSSWSTIRTCRKLLAEPALTREEQKDVRERLSDNLFDQGLHLFSEGGRGRAMPSLCRSVVASPSIKSLLKAGLILCCGSVGARLLGIYRSRRPAGFRRSDLDKDAVTGGHTCSGKP